MITRAYETPRGPVTLRTTTAEDGVALRDLRLRALREHPTCFGSTVEEVETVSGQEWSDRARDGAGAGDAAIVVAEAERRLVAMGGVRWNQRVKYAHSASIWGIYVQPEWRGVRLAERLVLACLDWAGEKGAALVRLSVVNDNTAAISCYARCGFVVYGVDPAVLQVGGMYYDELLMVRWLRPSNSIPPAPR